LPDFVLRLLCSLRRGVYHWRQWRSWHELVGRQSGQSPWCGGVSLPSETAHAKARTHPMIVQPKPILTAHARGQRGPLFTMATKLGKTYAPARTTTKPGAGKKSRGLCNRSTLDILAHGQEHGGEGWVRSFRTERTESFHSLISRLRPSSWFAPLRQQRQG